MKRFVITNPFTGMWRSWSSIHAYSDGGSTKEYQRPVRMLPEEKEVFDWMEKHGKVFTMEPGKHFDIREAK